MKTGKQAVKDLQIKVFDNINNKSLLLQRSDALLILNYIDVLEGKNGKRENNIREN